MTQCAPFDLTAIRAGVEGGPWRSVDVVQQTGSTNADLVARAAAGVPIGGTVLIAEQQTAGRGRNGRAWTTPARTQLAMSVGVDTAGVPAAAWGWLPLAAGVAVVDALQRAAGVTAGIKWPNDVVADGRKVAGLLAEVASASTVVLGMGINITVSGTDVDITDPDALPVTSLLLLGVEEPDRTAVLLAVLDELARRIDQWRTAGGAGLIADYRVRSATIGSRVRAVMPGGREVVGPARDVDDAGRLLVEDAGGTVAVAAGDVVHLRRA
ncbi:biotin--[Mycobacterium sp. MYCO198283]|uniref:biotin--[acetyl-CoA-carboxylase] ligase n=1 Tax=Mycobacterium sp. MYCO198283 TaxID=2883505 RepID=UPI001E492247|nr:biotin--[acetyl-CoA-carboxylase] ligase [Mycobacterium sp. MYCO198283]MCG5431640.1 biotin--[acetyl-CoA-carboxylase] ligase [Mycobacterium sp. MYCO198283]